MAPNITLSEGRKTPVDELVEEITASRFKEWYRMREHRRNIESGTPFFNGPRRRIPPEKHTPSALLQCHRKILYRQWSAPAEQPDPVGIFWFGSQFEEEIAFPFLERAVTGPHTYVRNTMWVDFTVESEVGELHIKGATDPVIVDGDSTPILPTEIKTKSTIERIDAPDRHHCAQVHAYLVGLGEKYDIRLTDAVILYGCRESLDVKPFHIEFDESFWDDVVLEWASEHTQYRIDSELPPPKPEQEWECEFCDYRERCGRGPTKTANGDEGPTGLLPLYTGYPRQQLFEYLEAHDGAKLTPSLGMRYPDLAADIDVYDWRCSSCYTEFQWDQVEWNGDSGEPPVCPGCAADGRLATLRGPSIERQRTDIEETFDA